jgi:predicted DNA binding CopG/RHH family protein
MPSAKGKADERLVEEFAKARREGRVQVGPIKIQGATEEEIEDARRDAEGLRSSRGLAAGTVPVTIRMRGDMIDRLKDEAARAGVRGYQTLIKQWIEERLNGEPMIAKSTLRQFVQPIASMVELPARETAPRSNPRVSTRTIRTRRK